MARTYQHYDESELLPAALPYRLLERSQGLLKQFPQRHPLGVSHFIEPLDNLRRRLDVDLLIVPVLYRRCFRGARAAGVRTGWSNRADSRECWQGRDPPEIGGNGGRRARPVVGRTSEYSPRSYGSACPRSCVDEVVSSENPFARSKRCTRSGGICKGAQQEPTCENSHCIIDRREGSNSRLPRSGLVQLGLYRIRHRPILFDFSMLLRPRLRGYGAGINSLYVQDSGITLDS
jgi:hypothetical protein